jgi:hypothetical protein
MAALPEPVTGSGNRIKAALWFAEHGFGVFSVWSTHPDGRCRCPAGQTCGVPGKHPITVNGFQDATTDAARIRTFLAAASRPNYGLVCPEGVFAWDVDGEGWQDRLSALEAQHGPLPPTLRTDTANGQHVFLRWPGSHPRPLHKMFGWVTRWGSGKMAGYVIGPRSVHASGKEYTPAGVFAIADLPDAWARAALAGEPSGTITVGGRPEPESVLPGSRHDALRNTARHYAGTVRDPEALFAAVWAYNERMPQPKTREEVQRAIGDALIKYPADPVEEDPETGEVRVVRYDEPGLLGPADSEAFPDPPSRAAFRGLLGEAVEALAEGTDASEVGILAGLLAFCGALVPASSYFHRTQTTSPYLALVGESSIGRKGTAMFRAKDALSLVLGADIVNRARFDGLASGESLVNSLSEKQRSSYDQTAGVMMEEEYATHLAAAGRESSSLDSRMRQAFDGDDLYHRKVSGTITVQAPYWLPALIAITPIELRTKLPSGALTSGSGNRWLWLPVVRRKVTVTSTPPELPAEVREGLQDAHRTAAKQPMALAHAPGVSEALSEYDEYLWSESVGIAADMTRRFSIIAFRIAMIHAAVERDRVVGLEHVSRAVALTEYARSGMGWVFGETLGNRDATLLLRQLKENGSLTAGTLSKYLIRDPIRRQDAIDELVRVGLARVVKVQTGKRPRTELHDVPERGSFRAFRALIEGPRGPEGARSARYSDSRSDDVRDIAAAARVIARNDGTGWLRACRDYEQHQNQHRQTPEGWVCGACDEEEER